MERMMNSSKPENEVSVSDSDAKKLINKLNWKVELGVFSSISISILNQKI
jgi:hypothetical protein